MSVVRYRIRHATTYLYSGRIDLCHSVAHLIPREDEGQETLSHHIEVIPEPDFRTERLDYFGNATNYFAIQGSHESLKVISNLTVEKSAAPVSLPSANQAWDAPNNDASDPKMARLDATGMLLAEFLLPTKACPNLPEVRFFLEPSLTPGRDIMDLSQELMRRIFTEFRYVPGATDLSTPLARVLEQKQGVCQDFAHVMVSALRSVGIPARYVSGYLETLPPPGGVKLQGADASHAWVEVYSKATGWVGFDPTNNKLPGPQHLKIAHGRDYFDVQPLKGIFLGTGFQSLGVEVDVERL